jgi:hypothetical protein
VRSRFWFIIVEFHQDLPSAQNNDQSVIVAINQVTQKVNSAMMQAVHPTFIMYREIARILAKKNEPSYTRNRKRQKYALGMVQLPLGRNRTAIPGGP